MTNKKQMIIVSETNASRITKAIEEAEGRATARTITYEYIVDACNTIERELGVLKKHLEGVVFDVDWHAQNFPNAYKWSPESTHFRLTRQGGKWRVDNFERYYTRAEGHRFHCITLPEETKAAIIDSKREF